MELIRPELQDFRLKCCCSLPFCALMEIRTTRTHWCRSTWSNNRRPTMWWVCFRIYGLGVWSPRLILRTHRCRMFMSKPMARWWEAFLLKMRIRYTRPEPRMCRHRSRWNRWRGYGRPHCMWCSMTRGGNLNTSWGMARYYLSERLASG